MTIGQFSKFAVSDARTGVPSVRTYLSAMAYAHGRNGMASLDEKPAGMPRRKITLLGRDFHLPRSRGACIALGCALVVGGLLGFLPILGFWMVPVGLLVLSYEFAMVRRWRRKGTIWWHRRRRPAREAR